MSNQTLDEEERDLLERAEKELRSEDLDSEIHDLHSKCASDINNSGVVAQIDYIVSNYGSMYAIHVLRNLLNPRDEIAGKDHE